MLTCSSAGIQAGVDGAAIGKCVDMFKSWNPSPSDTGDLGWSILGLGTRTDAWKSRTRHYDEMRMISLLSAN